jgi:peptidoglycan/LPS O-acetylase OafA/YrhL
MKAKRIPSLDGLRGISILIVLLGHASHTKHFPLPSWLVDRAALGVQVFFVLSGYLITSLLLDEREVKGGVSLGRFYARRALRILPASYFLIASTTLLWCFHIVPSSKGDIIAALTYTMNYPHSGSGWTLGHLWSLSVEEQFYLCWPLLVKVLSPAGSFWIAASVAGIAPLIVGAVFWEHSPIGGALAHMFPLVADSISTGCLLAMALRRWHQPSLKRIALQRSGWIVPICGALIYWICAGHPRTFIPAELAVNASIAYCIARWSYFSHGPEFLNSGWLPSLGVLSYSIYLWQQPFLASRVLWATAFPQNLILALAAGAGSYYLLERPLLGLRSQLR